MLKLLSVFCVNVFNDSSLITKVISTIVDSSKAKLPSPSLTTKIISTTVDTVKTSQFDRSNT